MNLNKAVTIVCDEGAWFACYDHTQGHDCSATCQWKPVYHYDVQKYINQLRADLEEERERVGAEKTNLPKVGRIDSDGNETKTIYEAHLLEEVKSLRGKLIAAVKEVRDSDCGGWLKSCQSGLFSCADGEEKRLELMKKLNNLYKVAGV